MTPPSKIELILKSANESRFWMIVLRSSDSISQNLISESDYLFQETKEIANIFASSILIMKGVF